MDKYKLPEGLRDYLDSECYMKNSIAESIMDVFRLHNYARIETPTIEYYRLFSQGAGKVNEESLFKLSDNDGRILVLRPDMTLPISRIVSTKLKPNVPSKYSYLGNCFNLNQDRYRLREFTQAGVELINDSSVYADAEMIALAINTLLSVGLEDFLIDIGQVGFFKGIIDSFDISNDDKRSIAEHIYKKDIIGLVDLINSNNKLNGDIGDKSGINKEQLDILIKLPRLFGGIECLDEAESFFINDTSLEAIDNLRQIYELLDARGLSQYISFDLSLVNAMNYYSGIVFKGITKHFGTPILAGGRYDGLSSSFDQSIPATGFAIGVDNLLVALQRADRLPPEPVTDYVIGYDVDGYEQAIAAADKLRQEGYVVDTIFTDSKESMIEYQKNKNTKCEKLIFIGKLKEDK